VAAAEHERRGHPQHAADRAGGDLAHRVAVARGNTRPGLLSGNTRPGTPGNTRPGLLWGTPDRGNTRRELFGGHPIGLLCMLRLSGFARTCRLLGHDRTINDSGAQKTAPGRELRELASNLPHLHTRAGAASTIDGAQSCDAGNSIVHSSELTLWVFCCRKRCHCQTARIVCSHLPWCR
jgi:hypothetical protein